MPDKFYDTVVLLFFTVVPLSLILLQIFLSTRKKLIWGFLVPILWTSLCVWILMNGKNHDREFSFELFLFFLMGDVILIAVLALTKYLIFLKKKQKNK